MNILLIGHSVVDKIIDKGNISIKPGGIFYTAISMLSQMEREDNLYLCTEIDEESDVLFNDAYNRVRRDFISNVASIPRVELRLENNKERKETYTEISQNLTLPKNGLNHFDGILINMISGYDISMTQLEDLRNNYTGPIYFDVHTLSRGVDKDLKRTFKKIEDFNKWAECINILQANESELLTLSDKNNESQIVEELFSFGIKQIIVTRAKHGSTVYFKEKEITQKIHGHAVQVNPINKIGCGDVFGAVYFYNYIKNNNILSALELANLFAGISTTYSNIKEYTNLKLDAIKQTGKK